jgi:hypothetical protein
MSSSERNVEQGQHCQAGGEGNEWIKTFYIYVETEFKI